MRLDDAPESGNVEDTRGMGGKLAVGGGLGGLLLVILGLVFGVDLTGGGGRGPAPGNGGGGGNPNPAVRDPATLTFTKKVLGTIEDVWKDEFAQHAREYRVAWRAPHLQLFSDAVDTGCGRAPSAVGPFYCPADEKIYIDPSFYDELERQLGGSKADFSKAYVIAHEAGHHVQNLLGYNRKVSHNDNQASVRLELMADYLAGVWAYHGQKKFKFIEPGDVEAAITSAKAIGDDRLQKRASPGGFVHPEKYTHGTSRQRVYFFSKGLKYGDASKATFDQFFSVPMRGNGEIQDF
jgi:predicted metalloprotease